MLFNSTEFIFLFLPLVVGGFFLLGRFQKRLAFGWLTVCSVAFYTWWHPVNILIITPSILLNYFLARRIAAAQTSARQKMTWLILGIAWNIAFIGYFKYRNFFLETSNLTLGTHWTLTHLILPLGISFITFQKIAFLVDVYAGRVTSFRFFDYCLFVMFFPQLIAGPIVHYREMMPQFEKIGVRPKAENFAVAITLFSIGLAKKVLLADSVSPYAARAFTAVTGGSHPSALVGWTAAVAYMLQIYFDFSGYSDMALGIARFFGIRLPMNFNSPLKATSIIDFWNRWHITLTRFLTAYIYNPLSISLTRRRLGNGKSILNPRQPALSAFAVLLAFPTMATMAISGFWHGAGFQFIVWGLLHGVMLTVNHGWRMLRPRIFPNKETYERWMTPVGFLLTLTYLTITMVFFRAPSLASAWQVLRAMFGAAAATPVVAAANSWTDYAWICGLLGIAVFLPNSLELLGRFDPALGFAPPKPASAAPSSQRTPLGLAALQWEPSFYWALGTAALAVVAILSLNRLSEFLYWQF